MTIRPENFGTLTPEHVQTPWGPADSWTHLSDGIDQYGTASHGGIRLSGAALDRFYATFPAFKTFAGPRDWFEEDTDWAAVCVLYHDSFLAQDVHAAVGIVEITGQLERASDGWKQARAWLRSPAGDDARTSARLYEMARAEREEQIAERWDGMA